MNEGIDWLNWTFDLHGALLAGNPAAWSFMGGGVDVAGGFRSRIAGGFIGTPQNAFGVVA